MLARFTVALLAALALSGCTSPSDGASVSIADSDVLPEDYQARELACPGSARLDVDASAGEGGDFTVVIKNGGAALVHSQEYAATAHDDSKTLPGSGGTWYMRVDRSMEYDGTFTVSLTCL